MNARKRRLLAGVLALLVVPSIGRASAGGADEYKVKAAIIFNFAKFVEWPADAFGDQAAPLNICVLGVDPFGSALDDALKGHSIGQRPAIVKRLTEVANGCHMLFVANSEVRRVPAILDRLGTSGVLTISEAEHFAERGGMIGLVNDGPRVRFEINAAAAERARLKISARVLALAATVHRSGDQAR